MKNKLLPAFIIASFLSLAFFSCTKKSEKITGDYGKRYFPLTKGHSITYEVDSTLWDNVFDVRTIHRYQMMWTVVDTFRDETNRISYRIQTYIRTQDTATWNAHRTILVTPTENTLEYVEAGLRFIKLTFPVQNGNTWKGNSLIHADLDADYKYFYNWDYYYSNFDQPYNTGAAYFDNTVTVNAINDTTGNPEVNPDRYAEKTFAKEVYGHDVGMVYREVVRWTYDPSLPGTPFRSGYSVVMRAINHN